MLNTNLPLLILIFFLQIFFNLFIIYIWNSPHLKKFHGVYQAEQKIHDGFIPRFGGLVKIIILICIFASDILPFSWSFILPNILLAVIPLLLVTFLEDVYNNIHPLARLFFIFLSSILIFIFSNFDLPIIDLPIVSSILNNHSWLLVLLLIISMVAMVNAFNFIDGANGLLLFNFICIFSCLKLMAIGVNDYDWIDLLNILITLCLVQLLFNFPKAFIFSGDLGAYSFGLLISVFVIIFFGKHSDFLTWQAIFILFYPVCELLFTMSRRYLKKQNPFQADRLHLHQQIFTFLQNSFGSNLFGNYFTTIILFPLWGFPFFWIYIYGPHLDIFQVLCGFGFNLALYLTYYFCFIKLNAFKSKNIY